MYTILDLQDNELLYWQQQLMLAVKYRHRDLAAKYRRKLSELASLNKINNIYNHKEIVQLSLPF